MAWNTDPPYEAGDVVLTDDGDEVEILTVMRQDEGPAYWVRYIDTEMIAVIFHEEIAQT